MFCATYRDKQIPEEKKYRKIWTRIEHICLSSNSAFTNSFLDSLRTYSYMSSIRLYCFLLLLNLSSGSILYPHTFSCVLLHPHKSYTLLLSHAPIVATSKKTLQAFRLQGLLSSNKNGGYLLSHGCAVPSARTGLTSLFGMGRGGTPTL